MKFRQATAADRNTILSIVRSAQLSLCESGIDQWQDGYPSAGVIDGDIGSGSGYVIVGDDGGIAAYGAVITTGEPAYDLLKDGAWHHHGRYVVIHRLCVAPDCRRQGFAAMFFRCAMQAGRRRGIDIIRVDTHADNLRMSAIIEGLGFAVCGKVSYRGAERTAFDRRIGQPDIATRPAGIADSALIADAVMAAFGDEMCQRLCCGAPREHIRDFFRTIASQPHTQYSYRNAMICTVDGIAAGAICGYDGSRLDELRRPVLEALEERFGALPSPIGDETQPGEFYLDSIGVAPLYRECGVGERLLRDMTAKARQEGAGVVALLVDSCNPSAERLYRRIGFRRSGTRQLLGHTMYHMTI